MTTRHFAALCLTVVLVSAAGCARQAQTPAPAPVAEPTATPEPTASVEPTTPAPVAAGDPATVGSWTISVREVESNLKGTDDSGGSGPSSGGSGAGDDNPSGDDNLSGDGMGAGAGAGAGDSARMKIEIMVTNNADQTLPVKTSDWELIAGGSGLKPVEQKDASKMGAREIEAGGTEDVTVFFDTPDISGVYTLRFTPTEGGPGNVEITVP